MTKKLLLPKGFSLIEVMIALLLGTVAIAAAYTIFNSQNKSAIYVDNKNEMNASINISSNLLVNDLRFAGYGIPASGSVNPMNNVSNTTAAGSFNMSAYLDGGTPFRSDVKLGTDALMLLQKDNLCTTTSFVDDTGVFTNAANGTAKVCQPNCFTAAAPTNFKVGDIGLVLGATGAIFVEIASITPNQTGACSGAQHTNVSWRGIDEFNLAIRNTTAPGNPGNSQSILKLSSHYIYYVNTASQMARWNIDADSVSVTSGSEIIADGVEDLQMTFDLTSTCTSASWCAGCKACVPPINYPTVTAPLTLAEIRGVRLGMVMRGAVEDKVNYLNKGGQISPFFDHSPGTTVDSFRRTSISQLVRVKNLEFQDFVTGGIVGGT